MNSIHWIPLGLWELDIWDLESNSKQLCGRYTGTPFVFLMSSCIVGSQYILCGCHYTVGCLQVMATQTRTIMLEQNDNQGYHLFKQTQVVQTPQHW